MRKDVQGRPFVARWTQAVPDGIYHWHIASLRSDGSYWGYVHIRTAALSENRSFDGLLPKDVRVSAFKLIGRVQALDQRAIVQSTSFDGLLGSGSRSDMDRIIACSKSDMEHSEAARCFYGLVAEIEPFVMQAARLC